MELFHLVVKKMLSQNNRDNEVSILYHLHYKCYMIIFSLTLCVVYSCSYMSVCEMFVGTWDTSI